MKEKKMGYSREYNEEKYIEIEKHLVQIEKLEEGKFLSIHYNSPEEAEKARWLFLDYFHLTGTSKSHKTTLFNNLLIVGKRAPFCALVETRTVEGLTKQLDTLIQELLSFSFPRRRLAELALDESLSFSALAIVLRELSRVLES